MLQYPIIDPVAIHLGPLKIHWYGLMYLIGFSGAWWLGRLRILRNPQSQINLEQFSDLIFWAALGVILGGRRIFILFYDLLKYLHNPLAMLQIWRGGMSFHGGLLGVLIAIWIFQYKYKLGFFYLSDFIAPLVPVGLGAGRIGNFINGELFGKITDLPWAMVFPYGGSLPRHPSQLYEAIFEGLILFTILWIYSKKQRPIMAVSGLFLCFYGIFRFLLEFSRQPDIQIGYIAWNWLTMGQILSVPMIIIGTFLLYRAYNQLSFFSKPTI